MSVEGAIAGAAGDGAAASAVCEVEGAVGAGAGDDEGASVLAAAVEAATGVDEVAAADEVERSCARRAGACWILSNVLATVLSLSSGEAATIASARR